jgi:Fur family ferric uptake transcriptional regulator
MATLDMVLEQLRQKGERLTLQRRLVIEALCHQPGHRTLANLCAQLQTDLPEPTVYRILQWLKDLGMISQTDMGESGVVYELVTTPPHHHLICLNCGRVIEVEDRLLVDLRKRLRDEFTFEPRIEHMAIYGYCVHCQARIP